jgi:small conductance mechanosensitive channel
MKKQENTMKFLLIAFGALFLLMTSPLAYAQQTPIPSSTSAPASALPPLPLPPLAAQFGHTLQTLVGVPTSQPGSTNVASTTEDYAGQITDTFATSILNTLAKAVDMLKMNSANWNADLTAWSDFMVWFNQQNSDPRRKALWNDISNDLLIIIGAPILISVAFSLLILPLRLNLKRNNPDTLPGRVGLLIGLFFIRMIPVLAFLGSSLLLLDQNEEHKFQRFILLNIIYALTIGYTIRQIVRGIFAPTAEHLRLLSLSTTRAAYAYRWLSAFSLIIVYGYFFIDVATALRVPMNAIIVFENIFGLILTVMAIAVIVRTRATVALILRGSQEEEDRQSFSWALRVWLAQHWHWLTITYLVIGLTVTLLGINNGIALLLRGTILSFLVLLASRLSFLGLDYWKTPKSGAQPLLHRQLLSLIVRPLIWITAVITIATVWGFNVKALVSTPSGQRIMGALLSIGLTLFLLTTIYEMIHAGIERHLNRRDKINKQLVATPRARTLLPMIRNTVFVLFCGVAILMCMSAVGINIGPLLAGAGVVGVAIGFGSQTLVKDFLTGLFIVAENTIAVGDAVTIGGFFGVVEALSIRTIRLRDWNGSLHILPFSEVSKITNMSKGFAFALVDIPVSYDSNLEHVMSVLREVGSHIQEDPIFKRVILEPIEVLGVENLGDSSITIRARIRTRPGKQWDVRRLLLLRIKQRFDQEKIEIPFPTVTSITKTIG